MELLVLLSVTLTVALEPPGSSREPVLQHGLQGAIVELSSDISRVEIFLPEPESRNPGGCESYEETDYEECNTVCRVRAYFAGAYISDTRDRHLDVCRPRGGLCQKVLTSKDGVNISVAGYCDRCACVPHEDFSLLSGFGYGRGCHDSSSETQRSEVTGEQASLKIRIPHPSIRNSTACEPYESIFTMSPLLSGASDACLKQCVIDQSIGLMHLRSGVRTLDGQMRGNGSTCYWKPTENEWLSVGGADLWVRGTCDTGVCVAGVESLDP